MVAITLMVLDHRNQYLTGVRKGLSVLLYPVEVLVSAPFDLGRALSDSVTTRDTLREENRQLKDAALKQSARLQRMAALEAENRPLAGTAGFHREGGRGHADRRNHVGGHESVPAHDPG